MKLHFLRYFVVLAEELHFGRAAARLSITQPPLSNAIKSLEAELDVQLLIRDSKHVELTQAGTAFLDEARQILQRIDRASRMARVVAKGKRGRLEIGTTSSLVYREVPRIVRRFNDEAPDVDVQLIEMSSADQIDHLLRGQLHAGFVNGDTAPPKLASLALRADEFVACLPDDHPLAGRRRVTLKALADQRFVMFSRDVAPANYDNVIAVFSRAGIHPVTAHSARQWLTIVALVANGMGVSLVPRSLARSAVHGVRFVRLSDRVATAPAMLAWNPRYHPPALDAFLNTARRETAQTA